MSPEVCVQFSLLDLGALHGLRVADREELKRPADIEWAVPVGSLGAVAFSGSSTGLSVGPIACPGYDVLKRQGAGLSCRGGGAELDSRVPTRLFANVSGG